MQSRSQRPSRICHLRFWNRSSYGFRLNSVLLLPPFVDCGETRFWRSQPFGGVCVWAGMLTATRRRRLPLIPPIYFPLPTRGGDRIHPRHSRGHAHIEIARVNPHTENFPKGFLFVADQMSEIPYEWLRVVLQHAAKLERLNLSSMRVKDINIEAFRYFFSPISLTYRGLVRRLVKSSILQRTWWVYLYLLKVFKLHGCPSLVPTNSSFVGPCG